MILFLRALLSTWFGRSSLEAQGSPSISNAQPKGKFGEVHLCGAHLTTFDNFHMLQQRVSHLCASLATNNSPSIQRTLPKFLFVFYQRISTIFRYQSSLVFYLANYYQWSVHFLLRVHPKKSLLEIFICLLLNPLSLFFHS